MNKVLALNRSVGSLCEEFPELIDIMVSLGFKPSHKNELGYIAAASRKSDTF